MTLRRGRAIHIDGDVIQRLVVSGSATMDVPPPPGALEQLRLRFQAALTVANLYRDAGFDAIISDNLFAEEARRFLAAALQSHRSRLVHFVMLNPSIETITKRYNERPGGGYTASLTPEMLQAAVQRTDRFGLWLDTTDQTPARTADDVLRRLHLAEITHDDIPPSSTAGRTTAR